MAANHRSVPIATAGLSLNAPISSGVISEPPPTPVSPTIAPTPKPLAMAIQSMFPEHVLFVAQRLRASRTLGTPVMRWKNLVLLYVFRCRMKTRIGHEKGPMASHRAEGTLKGDFERYRGDNLQQGGAGRHRCGSDARNEHRFTPITQRACSLRWPWRRWPSRPGCWRRRFRRPAW